MTAIAVWLEGRSALVGADVELANVATPGLDAGAIRWSTTKIYALPHVPAVITGRGLSLYVLIAFGALLMLDGTKLETLAEAMLYILEKSDPEVEKIAAGAGLEALAQQQVILMGWSAAQGRMVGWRYERQCMEDGFTETPVTNFLAAPWDDSWPKPWRPNTVETMADMLGFQVRRLREHDASYAAGDKFIIATLTPERIVFEKVAEAHGVQSNLAGAAA